MSPPIDVLLPIFSPLMAIVMWNMCNKDLDRLSFLLDTYVVSVYELKIDQLITMDVYNKSMGMYMIS